VSDFEASLSSHFAALAGKAGLSAGEAAALALRLASGGAPPPLDASALAAAFDAQRAALPSPADSGARLAYLEAACRLLDADALSRAFLLPQPPAAAEEAPQLAAQRLSLDLPAAARAFEGLEGVRRALAPDPSGDAALRAALAASLVRAQHALRGGGAGAGGALRGALLLLLACPSLRDPGWGAELRRLLELLAALPPAHAALAGLALQALPVQALRSLLEALQSFLLAQFYSLFDPSAPYPGSHRLPAALRAALAALAQLHAANEARPAAEALGQHEFACDALNGADWIDPGRGHSLSHLQADYQAWAAAGGGGGGRGGRAAPPPPSAAAFSFAAYPFLYTPATKARMLGFECSLRQQEAFSASLMRSVFDTTACPYCILNVRRSELVADAARELARRAADITKPLKVVFVGEEGVDEGGPTREFFRLLTRTLFSPERGMFAPQGEAGGGGGGGRLLWFAPGGAEAASEADYELAGTVLGLALYNGTLLELSFPRLLYKLLQGGAAGFDDLAEVSPELHRGLCALLATPADQVEQLQLTFSVDYEAGGQRRSAELVPGGAARAVDAAGARAYVAHYADWLLSRSVRKEWAAFRRGFARLVSGPAVRLFRAEELEQLLCGSEELDFSALQAHAQYGEGTNAGDPLATRFWAVAHSLPAAQRKRLLAFVTGSDRVPIGGLAALPFKLQRNGSGDERLPTAHTCFNTLMLPDYSSEEALRDRLLLALENSEGFGLR